MFPSSLMRKRVRLSMGSSSPDPSNVLQDVVHEHFRVDLRKMVNQDESSDVIFICNDGGRVKAIRSLLANRCNVLKGMLANGMRETSLPEINLPNISSQALLCVFEFLYTGTVLAYQPKTWKLLFEAVVAAQYFLLNDLVSLLLELILNKIPEIATDLPEVASLLTTTLEFIHSYQENGCHAIKRALVELLSSNWTHSTYASNLSEEALHYLLSDTTAANDDSRSVCTYTYKIKKGPSLTEYHRFRQVILWWAYENVSGWSRQAQELVESAVPLITDRSSLYFGVGIGEGPTTSDPSLRLNSLLKASRDSAMRLLSIIDLRYMHLTLFEKVVKPLNCFSSSEIMGVFRFHAFDRIDSSITSKNATCSWKHGTSLTVCEGESFIENNGCDAGTAIALMQMSSNFNLQLWKFVIMADRVSHIEMGFIFINADRVSRWGESESDNEPLFGLDNTRVLRIIVGQGQRLLTDVSNQCGQPKLIHTNIRQGSGVEFRYDFLEHNCSLSVDGRDFGICWENLPELNCYPAVFIGKSSSPRSVRIRMHTPRIR